jgi:hypothetical protein
MNDHRVLIRRGARELNVDEVNQVSGGIATTTLCTAAPCGKQDGDNMIGECGCPSH